MKGLIKQFKNSVIGVNCPDNISALHEYGYVIWPSNPGLESDKYIITDYYGEYCFEDSEYTIGVEYNIVIDCRYNNELFKNKINERV